MNSEGGLDTIAAAMRGTSAGSSLDAGYTYLGQLISHDIVPPTRGTPRYFPHELWLRSIYGEVDDEARYFNKHSLFVTGKRDINRHPDGLAVIPDDRNDENVIVSQLHLFWQKLHNSLLDKGLAKTHAEARKTVVLLFQLIVIEDYLKQLLTPKVFAYHFEQSKQILNLTGVSLPQEFSLAAFRFGHSMVRDRYKLKRAAKSFLLSDLFRPGKKLIEQHEIDWSLFFETGDQQSQPTQKASGIDPLVSEGMVDIQRPSGTVDIVRANLRAGSRMESGVVFRDKLFGLYPDTLGQLEIPVLHHKSGAFADIDLSLSDLPLWPYLLMEAASTQRGRRLGGLGSLIVADVLATSIRRAPISVFTLGSYQFETAWEKLSPLIRDAFGDPISVCSPARKLTMSELIQFVET